VTTSQSNLKINNFTPFLLEDIYNEYEGKYKHNLSSACMPPMSLNDLLAFYPLKARETFSQEILESKLDYSEQYGSYKTREALVTNLYQDSSPNDFLLTTGASEAIFLVMTALFEAGDSIIVQKPIYQSLYQVAEDRGIKIIDWDLDLTTMTWDLDKLNDLISSNPNAKALIINNPNNPVGNCFSRDELLEISKILDGRYLVSDEVFLPISLKPSKAVSEIYEKSISISDLSKSFNMPGLRLGWITMPSSQGLRAEGEAGRSNMSTLSSLKNYLSLRNNTLSELIAPWLLNKSKEITDHNKKIISDNLNFLYSQDPDDLFFDLSQKQNDIVSLCFFARLKKKLDLEDFLSKDCFIALGKNFGSKYQDFARIGLGQSLNARILG
jgi:aspartate/methionine/tyrosine aminotransferase